MKHDQNLKWLIPSIFLLALFAAIAGLWPGNGEPYPHVNFRGERVLINNSGLYRWDTVSSAAQMKANDLVLLILGLPLLAISFRLYLKNSLRGRLLLAGTLSFILYTYITMSFGAAYNSLFLVYVALFGTSLFALVFSIRALDIEKLPAYFSGKLPRRAISIMLISFGFLVALAWTGRIASTVMKNEIPNLENATSMFIQALDLAGVLPLCVIAGVLLLKKNAWGYLLASIIMMKFITLGIAVSFMGLNMARLGVGVNCVELGIFLFFTLVNLLAVYKLFASIDEPVAR